MTTIPHAIPFVLGAPGGGGKEGEGGGKEATNKAATVRPTPRVDTPHFGPTFTLTRQGAVTVEQDSDDDKVAKAFNVAVCPIGFREDKPEFGIPELLFRTLPLDRAAVQRDIARWSGVAVNVVEDEEQGSPAFRILVAGVS